MIDAYIVDAVRTPFGKRGGTFRDTHPQDLAAEPLLALKERNDFIGERDIEDVIYGCVTPMDEQGLNIGRIASLVAGWDDDVPGVQLNRACGSGQQAVEFAATQIAADRADIVVAGGVEHMTQVPILSDSASEKNEINRESLTDTYFEHFDEITTQGEGAERIAEQWKFTREDADRIAIDSQKCWSQAANAGKYDDQVVPVETKIDGEPVVLTEDEHPRPETDTETLTELPLVFRSEGEGVVHAGNASGIVDGAAATLVASEDACEELDRKSVV